MKKPNFKILEKRIGINSKTLKEFILLERVKNPEVVAGDFRLKYSSVSFGDGSIATENAFILLFDFITADENHILSEYKGFLCQGTNPSIPTTFRTPEAVMSNVRDLYIKEYKVNNSNWRAQHYSQYNRNKNES